MPPTTVPDIRNWKPCDLCSSPVHPGAEYHGRHTLETTVLYRIGHRDCVHKWKTRVTNRQNLQNGDLVPYLSPQGQEAALIREAQDDSIYFWIGLAIGLVVGITLIWFAVYLVVS